MYDKDLGDDVLAKCDRAWTWLEWFHGPPLRLDCRSSVQGHVGPSTKNRSTRYTDQLIIKGGLGKAKKNEDLASVARVALPDRPVCFVCAGRTADGTTVAGYFIARKWTSLLERYESESKDLRTVSMVGLLTHKVDEMGSKELTTTGQVARIAWWSPKGVIGTGMHT